MNDKSQAKLALTGATGFIARGVIEACADASVPCRALSRGPRPAWAPSAVEWCTVASYTDTDSLSQALAGSSCLLHLADNPTRAVSRSGEDAVHICSSVIEAARRSGTRRAIVASSIYSRQEGDAKVTSYGTVKRLVEQYFLTAPELQTIILRLPPVYGPGGGGGFAALSRLVGKRYPLPFGMAAAPRAYLSRRNLSSLVLTIANADEKVWLNAAGGVFEPSDGSPTATRELIRAMAIRMNVIPRLLPVPLTLLRFCGTLTGKSELLSGAIDELAVAPVAHLERLFGWQPVERMPESLAFLADEVRRA